MTEYNAILLANLSLWGFFIITMVGLWGVFEKVGESGWKSLIPFYNLFVLTRITKRPRWLFWIIVVIWIIVLLSYGITLKLFASFVNFASLLATISGASAHFPLTDLAGNIIAMSMMTLIFMAGVSPILTVLIILMTILIHCLIMFNLAKTFGRSQITGIGLVFLPMVFVPILGFGKAQYIGIERKLSKRELEEEMERKKKSEAERLESLKLQKVISPAGNNVEQMKREGEADKENGVVK